MLLRPVDSAGDILPVLSASALLSGAEAVAQLAKYRLTLLTGEWWENPSVGFPILEDFQSSRLTESGGQFLSSRITSYIRQTSGVQEVEDVVFSVSGRQFQYVCILRTEQGTTSLSYSFS